MKYLKIAVTVWTLLAAFQCALAEDRLSASGMQTDRAQSQSIKPKAWRFRLAVQPDVGLPVGDYYKGFDAGFGYGADLSVRLNQRFAVRLGVSRSGTIYSTSDSSLAWFIGNDWFTQYEKLRIVAWRATAALELHNWPRFEAGGRLMYYFYSGLGMIDHFVYRENSFYINDSSLVSTANDSHVDRKFLFGTGGGVMLALTRHVGVNIGADVDMVFPVEQRLWTSYIFDLKIGLVVFE